MITTAIIFLILGIISLIIRPYKIKWGQKNPINRYPFIIIGIPLITLSFFLFYISINFPEKTRKEPVKCLHFKSTSNILFVVNDKTFLSTDIEVWNLYNDSVCIDDVSNITSGKI